MITSIKQLYVNISQKKNLCFQSDLSLDYGLDQSLTSERHASVVSSITTALSVP